jgi:hypothetical protein
VTGGPVLTLEALTRMRFVEAMTEAGRLRGHSTGNRWDMAHVLAGHPERVGGVQGMYGGEYIDQRVLMVRARDLQREGIIGGCTCGCRGDFELRLPRRPAEPEPEWAPPRSLPEVEHDVIVIDTNGAEWRLEWTDRADDGSPHGVTGWAEVIDGMHMDYDVIEKWRPLTRWET